MSPTTQLQAFAQSVYLTIKNRYYDDIGGADGLVYTSQIVDFTNQFLDELELETDPSGQPVDWDWNRQMNYPLGTAIMGNASVLAPTEIFNLIAEENRYVQVQQGGIVISNWAVVDPSQISSLTDRITEDMVALVGGTLVFSRVFKDTENNGSITGDVTLPLPRIVFNATTGNATNVKALTLVKPLLLLKLGVAKNASLPDIVKGKLSPSYAQKFDVLLQNAIARNGTSSRGDTVLYDNYGYISGVGF